MTCCGIAPGALRTPCVFERKVRVDDGAGSWGEVWQPIPGAPEFCAFKALSGSERLEAQRINATVRARIAVRYFPGLRESDRVLVGGRAYAITFINNVGMRNHRLEIDLGGGVAT